MGIGASMLLWWEQGFCGMLADGGRFVIRYDHRDTGRSVTYEPGRPEYAGGGQHSRAFSTCATAACNASSTPTSEIYNHHRAHTGRITAGRHPAQLIYGARKMEPR